MSTTAIAITDQPIIVDELVEDSGFRPAQVISSIRISKTNRTRFTEEAMRQLSESIKKTGVLQPILIRPVTPTESEPEPLEIVAGERRYRASIMAGLKTIPVMIKELSDLDAAKIQILENLHRENPHEMEEAEGFERLMMNHGYTAVMLAEEIKQSRAYVYARLKLCALCLEARERFLNNEFPASTALLIARIPVPSLQVQALAEIMNPAYSQEPMSYRSAVKHIQDRYMLQLDNAPFQIADAKLVKAAGSCVECPKRTGNQPEIFTDVKNDHICTDPDCFAEKRGAQDAKTLVAAHKKGIPVYDAEDSDEELEGRNLIEANTMIWYFDRVNPKASSNKSIADTLTEAALPQPSAYVKYATGRVVAAYDQDAVQLALQQAGICFPEAVNTATPAETKANDKYLEEQKQQAIFAKQAADETAARTAIYRQIRQRAVTNGGFGLDSLRAIAKLMLTALSLPKTELADIYPFDTTDYEQVAAHIDQAALADVHGVILDMVFAPALNVSAWDFKYERTDSDDYEAMLELAKIEGIDPDQVRQSLLEPVKEAVADNLPADKPKRGRKPAAVAKPDPDSAGHQTELEEVAVVDAEPAAKVSPVDAWPSPRSN